MRVHFGENVVADTEKLTVTAFTDAGQAVGYFDRSDVGFVSSSSLSPPRYLQPAGTGRPRRPPPQEVRNRLSDC